MTEEKEKTTTRKGVSRRQFIAGTVGGLVVGAAAGAVSGSLGFPKTITEQPWLPAKWDYTADVVVVGFGFAGQTSAITASDAGASVIVLEKTDEANSGGNSRVCGQCVAVPTDIPGANDYIGAMSTGQGYPVSADLISTYVNGYSKNKDWLEGLGAPLHWDSWPSAFYPELPGSKSTNGAWYVTDAKGDFGVNSLNWQFLKGQVAKRNIQILYQTPASGLVQNPQTMEVLGVVATTNSGDVYIKANKAVILCSGGFVFNQDMVRNYLGLPELYSMGSPNNTGDGIKIAADAGADLWHMDVFAAPSGYCLKVPSIDYVFPVGDWATGLPTKGGFIRIAGDNNRYADEIWEMNNVGAVAGKWKFITPSSSIDSHGKYVAQPYPTPIHIIFDDLARQNWSPVLDTQGGYGWASVVANYTPSSDLSTEVANGWVLKADTISELATAMGRDPTAVGQTVTEWNTGCANGTDTVFGRTSVLQPIQTPPFYAIELKPMLLNTQGGPVRNASAQVLDKNGNPIPRLYEAGEMGDMFSWLYECCHNVSGCYAFGQIAGKNAATETPWS